MYTKTFWKAVLLGLAAFAETDCVWGGAPTSSGRTEAGELAGPVSVAVYNEAGVPADVLARAEAVGEAVFRAAGLEVEWLTCGLAEESEAERESCMKAVYPTHLQLRIVGRGTQVKGFTFGMSYLGEDGTGCYSTVFFEPLAELSARLHRNTAMLLGHVMAHEVAHLLLGMNPHTAWGIMRARWQAGEVERAGQGTLLFTAEEGAAMRRRVVLADEPAATKFIARR